MSEQKGALKAISPRARRTLINLAQLHAEGSGPRAVRRPDAATTAVYRALKRRGLITFNCVGGAMSMVTLEFVWTDWEAAITEAGLREVDV